VHLFASRRASAARSNGRLVKKNGTQIPLGIFQGGRGSSDHVGEGVLTQRLELMFKDGRLTKKLTSHGGRGFYVLVNRSNGVHDSQTAAELNQVGGLETLRESYGVIPQHWLHGKGPKLKWLPAEKKDYAWAKLFTKLASRSGTKYRRRPSERAFL